MKTEKKKVVPVQMKPTPTPVPAKTRISLVELLKQIDATPKIK